jgi:serine phosphatase RsbU (regulator of sigma subunit)
MSRLARRPVQIRLAVVTLALALAALAVVTAFRWGSSATDENLFTEPMSTAYVTTPMAASTASEPSLVPGDLILAVGQTRVRRPAEVGDALSSLEGHSADVAVTVHRPTEGKKFATRVPGSDLRASPLRDISRSVVVIAVTPGGASDRAGMKVGDVITRINGLSFDTAIQADSIMRSAQIGRATDYAVLRANQPLTLHVTLASFGFEWSRLAVLFTGLAWMAFGAALALARPNIKAALTPGLMFLLLGFLLSVVAIRRDLEVTPFVFLRDAAMLACGFVGLAVAAHSEYYFPRERTAPVARRWTLWLAYGVAALATVAGLVWRKNPSVAIGLVATVLAAQPATWYARRERGADERQMLRVLRWVKLIVGALTIATLLLMLGRRGADAVPAPFLLLTALLLPAAYLYTIARYRLLDLDLRVRRSVQYTLASMGWSALSIAALLWVLWHLPSVSLPLPNLRVSGASLELLDGPMPGAQRALLEKGVLMVAAIGLAFLFRAIGRGGQQWIADKFHRTAYDYRRASRELADVMSTRLDLDGLADGVIKTLVRLMPLKRAGVMFAHAPRTYCGALAHGFTPDEWAAFCTSASADVTQACARATSEVDTEYVFPRLRRTLEAADLKYLFPIRSHEALVGVILVGEKRSEAAFEDDDFQFLGAIAHQVSAGVENAFLYEDLAEQERLRHELEIARRIQLESLPQFTPIVEGLEISGVSIPAFEVGGDYYDYLDGEPRQLTVVVGDVSGKGTSAALYMSKLQGIMRSLHAFNLTPHELFVRTNELLSRDLERRSFVTALGGFFHTKERRLVLARAGHLPLYHYSSAHGEVQRVLPRGLGFGLSQRQVFGDELEEREIAYVPGDVFLFITDGITECLAATGEEFGEERVMSVLGDLAPRGTPAPALRDELLHAVRRFAPNVEQHDDQTVVVVRAVA